MAISFRRGTLDDSFAVWKVFADALLDLSQRQGVMAITGANDADDAEKFFTRRKTLFEHLARTAHEFWLAEQEGNVVGYARSILRGDVLELTEFFVLPDAQSAGLGKELLQRAFPLADAKHHLIVATTDVRAQIRYLKIGVVPRFPEMYWSRAPEQVEVASDLEFVCAHNTPETLAQIAEIDRAILGHTREVDHAWLLEARAGYLYKRAGNVVGYGYHSLGGGSGPFALYEERDFAAVLAHAEREALRRGDNEVGFDIPMLNRAAIDYFLQHKYELDSFLALVMSNAPLGKWENYIMTNPAFFI